MNEVMKLFLANTKHNIEEQQLSFCLYLHLSTLVLYNQLTKQNMYNLILAYNYTKHLLYVYI